MQVYVKFLLHMIPFGDLYRGVGQWQLWAHDFHHAHSSNEMFKLTNINLALVDDGRWLQIYDGTGFIKHWNLPC